MTGGWGEGRDGGPPRRGAFVPADGTCSENGRVDGDARDFASPTAPPLDDAAAGITSWPRNLIFAGLAAIGFANGAFNRSAALVRDDATAAFLNTLGISALVWVALAIAIWRLLLMSPQPACRSDWLVAVPAALCFLLPPAPLSWLALTGLGIYLVSNAAPGHAQRRAGFILLAITVPMFWSRLLMSAMSDVILWADAVLVATLLSAERVGNTIAFGDGWGYFWIAPECSSLANISLALLTWVLLRQGVKGFEGLSFAYAVLAVAAVVAINVGRMALTGLSRGHHELIHSPMGYALFDTLTLVVMLAVMFVGYWRLDLSERRKADVLAA